MFGGTFDPVHVGHVVVAAEARAQLGLDRVLLVVAGDPWQKRGRVVASAADRLALVDAAVAGVEGVEASALEVERDGAVGHRRHARGADRPTHRELFLVLGADAVANMGTWRRLDETRDLATVVVVERAGDARTRSRRAPGGGSSACRSRASTSRRPTCGSGSATGGRSTGSSRAAVVRAIHQRGLYTDGR